MAARRLPAHRVAGIAAWTAASVAWGTTLVTMANAQTDAPVDDLALPPEILPVVEYASIDAPMPIVPSTGLVVLRYTPVDKPEPVTVVRRVVQSGGGGTAPASTKKQTKTKSSGS